MSSCCHGMVILFFIAHVYFTSLIVVLHLLSMEGGELFQRIQERADGGFTERGKIY